MAKSFLSTAILQLHSSSSPSAITTHNPYGCIHNSHHIPIIKCCRIAPRPLISYPVLPKRSLTVNLLTTLTLSFTGKGIFDANATILEADDDVELLEKSKKDREKRIEMQASTTETAYLQELVNKLGRVGQAIRDDKLSVASSVLGPSSNADWIKKANAAFTKLSSSPEETMEVDTLNSSLTSLIASVARRDMRSTKAAFVSSVVALEKWTSLTGLVGQLQGL